MPQIRRIRKRKAQQAKYLEDDLPVIDAVAVKARLSSFLARWTVYSICLGLVALVLIVFSQVVEHQFIDLGDKAAVYGNPLVTSGLRIEPATHVFTRVDHDSGGYYAPLTMISHMIDWTLNNRLDDKAARIHHTFSMLLHGITVLLLFLTLRIITGAIWRSALVSVLFAIHPLQVESVSWVAQRGDVLCGLFFILAIDAYVRYVYRPWSLLRYSVVLVLFVLGLLSHPAMVAFPIILLLLDYWPLSRYQASGAAGSPRDFVSVFLRLFTEKIPFLAISFVVYIVTVYAQGHVENSLDNFSLPVQVNNALFSCLTYIARVLKPTSLTVFYPQGSAPKFFFETGLAFTVIVAVTVAAFFLRKKHPYLLFGWLWFIAMLAPAIGWGLGGLYAGSDHFGYLPLIGLYFIIAWGGWDLCGLLPLRWRTGVAAAALAICIPVLAARAHHQCSYWADGITLWGHARDITKDNYVAYDNLANAFLEEGDMDAAIASYTKALSFKPDYAEAEDDFGMALIQKGDLRSAVEHYKSALTIRPHYAEAYIDLGEALVQGRRLDDAIAVYNKALEIRPDYADAHYNLGRALVQKGGDYLTAAIAQFQKAVEIRPYYADAHFNLGIALSQPAPSQNIPEAITHLKEAITLRPNFAEAEYALGLAYYQTQDLNSAVSHLRNALQIKPNYEEAHFYLGLVLVDQGRIEEAMDQYQKALEIGPNYKEIYNNIARAMVIKKDFPAAISNYEKSVQIAPDFLLAKNGLAWELSTCPNPALRDGKRAIALVENEANLSKDPILLRTLAAAYAEVGRYDDAVATAKLAKSGLDPKVAPGLASGLQSELELYEAGKPFHSAQD